MEAVLQNSGTHAEEQLRLAEETFDFASTARERFTQADAMTKKQMVMTFGSNLTLTAKKLRIEAREPFSLLQQSMSGKSLQTESIEPEKSGLPQGWNGGTQAVRPSVLGDRDSNPNTQDQNLMSYH